MMGEKLSILMQCIEILCINEDQFEGSQRGVNQHHPLLIFKYPNNYFVTNCVNVRENVGTPAIKPRLHNQQLISYCLQDERKIKLPVHLFTYLMFCVDRSNQHVLMGVLRMRNKEGLSRAARVRLNTKLSRRNSLKCMFSNNRN